MSERPITIIGGGPIIKIGIGPQGPQGLVGPNAAWGNLTGTLSDQSDLWGVLGGMSDTISGFGDVVGHAATDFATAAQGVKADTALQVPVYSAIRVTFGAPISKAFTLPFEAYNYAGGTRPSYSHDLPNGNISVYPTATGWHTEYNDYTAGVSGSWDYTGSVNSPELATPWVKNSGTTINITAVVRAGSDWLQQSRTIGGVDLSADRSLADIGAAPAAGVSSIITLGTVTTGAWNGTVITGQYGGTGVANTGKTITLAGHLVTTGTYNTTFAQQGSTTVTLPSTSATMARTDAAQTFAGTQTFSGSVAITLTITSTGGAQVKGSISGLSGGELILGQGGVSVSSAISTLDTGTPRICFDHRGTSNTGDFVWRNWTGATSVLMQLTNTGVLIPTTGISNPGYLTITGVSSLNGPVVFGRDVGFPSGVYVGTIGQFGSPANSLLTSSFSVAPTNGTLGSAPYSLGIVFTTSSTRIVRKLGKFWQTGNTGNRKIRLWNSSDHANPLVLATILGSSTSDANGIKWVDIPPQTLIAGQTYALMIDEDAGQNWNSPWSPTLQSGITFGKAYGAVGGYPDSGTASGSDMYSAPAMGYTTTALLPNEGALNAYGTTSDATAYGLTTLNAAGVPTMRVRNDGVLLPFQAATASAPTYAKGGIYFDTTLNKLRVGGATAWETITSV